MPDKKPEKSKISPYFLNTASQFLLKFSPNPAIRNLNQALAPAARAKRRQEYGLNPWPDSPSPEAPSAPSAPSAPPPAAASKPSFGTNMRDFAIGSQERADEYTKRGWAQDATTKVSQQNKPAPASSASSTAPDFKKIGAISTASGGNTDYDAGLGFETQNPFRIAAKTAKATPATETFSSSLTETAKATPATETAPTLSKKEARQEKRAKRLEGRIAAQTAKGKTAVSEGRFIDAGNKQGRVQNLQKRVDRLRK
jgi:hypothetical protein